MKKILCSLMVITSLIACETKTNTAANNFPVNATGYNLDSSDNIVAVKKAIDAGMHSDTAEAKLVYADTATVYDNKTKQTLAENMQMSNFFKTKGATIKVDKINFIWESVNNKEDSNGVKNFVFVYMDASVTKGDKKVVVGINAVFAFKNGKIVTEWDTYDSAPIMDLIK